MEVEEYPSISSRLRLAITLSIVLMVISSPTVIVANTGLAKPSTSSTPLPTISTTPSAPSTIGQDGREGDFTTQAALQIPRTFQSTDIVGSTGIYEVSFITSTTGAIDKIRMDFPTGTNIGAAGVIEKVGIGGGTLLKAGSSITYDVTTPVSVPAGTFIRLEISGIKNPSPPFPPPSFTATITTRDSGGNLIDGPSQTNAYTIKQIGTNEIADGSITLADPAQSFMKRNTLVDFEGGGHTFGWNPDGVTTTFEINESALDISIFSYVSAVVQGVSLPPDCRVTDHEAPSFSLLCDSAPAENAQLHYIVINLPGLAF